MITKVEGFILSTVNYGESSLVIQLFTKEFGIIGLMAKGVKSMKNKLHALTLRYTYGFFYIYYKEHKLSILKDVDLIDPLSYIHEDLTRLSYMAYLSDLTEQVYKESNEEELYDLFITALLKMEQGFDPLVLTNILEVKYLDYLGVGLSLEGCIKCRSTTNIVTILDGGLLCLNCYSNEPLVDKMLIKYLRLYKWVDLKSIQKLNVNEQNKLLVDRFLSSYYSMYTGLYLKSKHFLEKLKGL